MGESTPTTVRSYWKIVLAPTAALLVALLGGTGAAVLEGVAGFPLQISPWVIWLVSLFIATGAGVWGWYKISRHAVALSRKLHDKRLPQEQRACVHRLKQAAGRALTEARRGGAMERDRVDEHLEQVKLEAGALAEFGMVAKMGLAYRVLILAYCVATGDQRDRMLQTAESGFDLLVAFCNELLAEYSTAETA